MLNNGAINLPKNYHDMFKLRKGKNGELLGWEIINKRVFFYNNDFLKVDEKAKSKKALGEYLIEKHTYHFNPHEDNDLERFRIDKKRSEPLHANDERNGNNLHLSPEQLKLDINNFNLYLAIHLSLLYISKRKYPLDDKYGNEYNAELIKHRRECNG
jgi:hypothetical protein